MRLLDDLGSRMLALVGLDFALDLRDEPFHRITPDLYLGARPRPEAVDALHQAGITHVVSCLEESERASVAFLKGPFQTRFFALRDSVHTDLGEVFGAFVEAMEQARGEGGRLLVHCQVGVSRSASLATALVMQEQGERFFEAYQQVRRRRAQVLPNIGFASQLQQLEHRIRPDPRLAGEPSSLASYLHQVCQVPIEIEALEQALSAHDHQALPAIQSLFIEGIPRVVQGVRL